MRNESGILLKNHVFQTNTTSHFYENVKGTLMQIWKFHYMIGFILKQYPENFALLMLEIIEFITREICIFLKK